MSDDTACINFQTADERRMWKALTRCASSDAARSSLTLVAFDGRSAWATDAYVAGVLDAPIALPGHAEGRVAFDAGLLRDALGMVKGKTAARLLFRDEGGLLVIGDDPLPLGDQFGAPEVHLPYADVEHFPSTDKLRRWVAGVDEDGIADAEDVATRLGLNASNLARVAALASRADGSDDLVTIHPRSGTGLIEVREVPTGRSLGVMARVSTLDEEVGK